MLAVGFSFSGHVVGVFVYDGDGCYFLVDAMVLLRCCSSLVMYYHLCLSACVNLIPLVLLGLLVSQSVRNGSGVEPGRRDPAQTGRQPTE